MATRIEKTTDYDEYDNKYHYLHDDNEDNIGFSGTTINRCEILILKTKPKPMSLIAKLMMDARYIS